MPSIKFEFRKSIHTSWTASWWRQLLLPAGSAEARKLEYGCPQAQSQEKKEDLHKSSQVHVPTFWSLLQSDQHSHVMWRLADSSEMFSGHEICPYSPRGLLQHPAPHCFKWMPYGEECAGAHVLARPFSISPWTFIWNSSWSTLICIRVFLWSLIMDPGSFWRGLFYRPLSGIWLMAGMYWSLE